jgi:hypothetical protein
MVYMADLSVSTYRKLLVVVLWLIAIHSICFGLTLIWLPNRYIELFGFTLPEKFFAVQGGVFHLIISYAYITVARDPVNSRQMVILSVLTKFAATIFLLAYYFFVKQIVMVMISGVIDFLMGFAVLLLYIRFMAARIKYNHQ